MSDLRATLETGIGYLHRIVDEVGSGGMATVFLA